MRSFVQQQDHYPFYAFPLLDVLLRLRRSLRQHYRSHPFSHSFCSDEEDG